ncbi:MULTISPECIES: hypothetical protein [Desulfococcus]|jgi:hypothetical protein|uniref:Uncharacterized protein n=1 Tax=Desulfococcus multivorans DSM 2059 TaxID=1121405 RepID=S7U1U3_DESML|nr:hypothetical protein [Desulfococcus multivorans]EPR43406.1 hypothetical protein dsmv_1197 [Desulfococcus multivorans DSM 2059]MDX9819639.1 hypothetical protein [Desulfococcus multivorans]SKA25686.1 hypothetical protein SAMN02745446_03566 [Desulfococcus multivorans DSM 2059]
MMKYIVYLGAVVALLDSMTRALEDGKITKDEWVGILKDVARAVLATGGRAA